MTNDVIAFQEKLIQAVDECRQLTFMTISKELQKDACNRLIALEEEGARLEKKAAALGLEVAANAALAFECIIKALISELRMWIALKDDDADNAWEHLIDAQTGARHAAAAHPVALNMGNYASRLEALENVLFPPQAFTSAGMVITSAQCSICNAEYGDCPHVKGRAYMGEICGRIIRSVTFTEISLVDEPADKRSRMLCHSEDGISWINRMTRRPTAPMSKIENREPHDYA